MNEIVYSDVLKAQMSMLECLITKNEEQLHDIEDEIRELDCSGDNKQRISLLERQAENLLTMNGVMMRKIMKMSASLSLLKRA